MSRSVLRKHWCFTWNNYPEDCDEKLKALLDEGKVIYLIYQREVGESGTPHLQGFLTYSKRVRLSALKKIDDSIHFEPAQNVKASINYCKKDDTRVEGTEFVEHGVEPDENKQGKRSDLDDFKHDVKSGTKFNELMETHSEVTARYLTWAQRYYNLNFPVENRETSPFEERPWHSTVYDWIANPDDRKVMVIIDEKGGLGKSRLAEHLARTNEKVQVLQPAKDADIAHAIQREKSIFIFDCPRCRLDIPLPFYIIEQIKNGRVFSPKYDSGEKEIERPNSVILMVNEAPDPGKLSHDRWVCYYWLEQKLWPCKPNETEGWNVMYPNMITIKTIITNHIVEKERAKSYREYLQDERLKKQAKRGEYEYDWTRP